MAEPLEMVAEDLWRMSDLEGMEQGQGSPWEIRAINMTSCLRKSAQEYTKENVRIYHIIIFKGCSHFIWINSLETYWFLIIFFSFCVYVCGGVFPGFSQGEKKQHWGKQLIRLSLPKVDFWGPWLQLKAVI